MRLAEKLIMQADAMGISFEQLEAEYSIPRCGAPTWWRESVCQFIDDDDDDDD